VGVAVIADLEPVGGDAAQNGGMLKSVLADDEEGCGGVLLFKDVEDLRGNVRVWPIIESQRDIAGLGCARAFDLIGHWQRTVAFAGDDIPAEVDLPRAARWTGGDTQDFAVAGHVGALGRGNR